MKDEIKELFPKEFYIKKDKKMYAEISLENLNKIADCITNLQENEAYYYGYYKDYKLRNEKAIEYIKNKQELNKMFGTITLSKDSQNELLNILGGDE